MAREDTRQYSLDDLERMEARGEYVSTRTDAPQIELDEDFWRNARIVLPTPRKKSVHLRLDADVLTWFREQGPGYLTRMNAVLRAFMEAHRAGRRRPPR
jgi:uncharacterized protein (DUF4415 family)